MRHTNGGSMTDANLGIYSMHESSENRLILSIYVMSWVGW